jgi:prevent-host-death family protein
MSEMPISDAREHLGEVVGRARYGGEETILTHYGSPAAVVISFEEYQRLKHARDGDGDGDYQLPAEIAAQISEGRQHPERRQPRPRRAARPKN